ncbi:MAG: type 1 glutamine amidotransferase domain-containing protein [Thermoguttaceae bacterium]
MIILPNLRVAILATDGFEETELTEPLKALTEAGAEVTTISLKPGEIQGVQHMNKTIKIPVDHTIDEIDPEQFDAVHLPGGAINADALRIVPDVQLFLQEIEEAGKPIAAICHAPWLLISAGLMQGRKVTSYHTIQDDVRNAGGIWLNQEVVEDDNWVTSRQPSDLPAYNRAMIDLFARSAVAH